MNNRDLIIALAFTESSLDYNAKHKRKSIKGICGISEPIWKEELQDNGVKVNSLNACLYVYEFYFNETNNKAKAIKRYKGIETKSNNYLINKVLNLEKKIKQGGK